MVDPASEQVVFENSVRGLFERALQGRLSDARLERLVALGVRVENGVAAAYPRDTWILMLAIAVEELAPDLSAPEAYRLLGQRLVEGVGETTLGKALVQLARLVGPSRTLGRFNRNVRASDNFTEAEITLNGARGATLVINDVLGLPTMYQGVIEAMLLLAGAKEVNVVLSAEAFPTATYRASWG